MNNRKAKILLKLATLDTDKTNRYLSNYIGNLLVEIQKSKNNDQKYEKLELLKQIIYQAPSKALRIIKEIINTKNPLKPKKQTIHGLTVSGKSHDDLIVKCIELLDKIRYLKTKEGFHLLIKLSDHPNDNIQFKAVEVLKNLCQYNLFILDKIGYFAQTCVLAEIKKWNNKKILTHANVLIEISNQFLRPSFKGHSMTDYKTFTLRHGPLVVNEELINIRKDTITILKKIFTLTSDLTLQKNILQVLNESTRTPARGEYKDDMKQMILTNTNELIDFYINILPGLEYEVISAIEEQSHWFTRKFGDKDIPQVRKLKKLIATNSDYQVFRVFVGYDRDYLEERDWKKAEKLRREKIQEYITDISSKNFKEWQKRILSVIKNYSSGQLGGYQYFSNIFLRGLGKKKPSIAFKLIQQNEKELEPFLLPLIAGIWKSRSSEIAKALVTKWIDSDKHLTICAALFDYVEEIDKRLLDSCFRKSKKKERLKSYYQDLVEKAKAPLEAHPLTEDHLTEDWMSWAKAMALKYQRTTSAIEGRNARLAQHYFSSRGVRRTHIKSLTIIHNFWIKRDDNSTAAQRLCGFKPPDLFEWLLKNMRELPLPRNGCAKITASIC